VLREARVDAVDAEHVAPAEAFIDLPELTIVDLNIFELLHFYRVIDVRTRQGGTDGLKEARHEVVDMLKQRLQHLFPDHWKTTLGSNLPCLVLIFSLLFARLLESSFSFIGVFSGVGLQFLEMSRGNVRELGMLSAMTKSWPWGATTVIIAGFVIQIHFFSGDLLSAVFLCAFLCLISCIPHMGSFSPPQRDIVRYIFDFFFVLFCFRCSGRISRLLIIWAQHGSIFVHCMALIFMGYVTCVVHFYGDGCSSPSSQPRQGGAWSLGSSQHLRKGALTRGVSGPRNGEHIYV
jgi:hypothetical protein